MITLSPNDIHVKVCEPRGDGERHPRHVRRCHNVLGDVVEQGPVLVVLGHQPELGPGSVVWRE